MILLWTRTLEKSQILTTSDFVFVEIETALLFSSKKDTRIAILRFTVLFSVWVHEKNEEIITLLKRYNKIFIKIWMTNNKLSLMIW